jgi:hypothetical protein
LSVDPETVLYSTYLQYSTWKLKAGIYSAVWCMLRAIVYTTVDTGKNKHVSSVNLKRKDFSRAHEAHDIFHIQSFLDAIGDEITLFQTGHI